MKYCSKCGKEIAGTESFCPVCGTKIPGDGAENSAPLFSQAPKSASYSGYTGKIINSYNNLKEAKPLFLATAAAFILNIALMFSDMIEIRIIFSSKSGSFIKVLNEMKKLIESYGGSASDTGDAQYLLPLLNIGVIAAVAAIVLTVLPIVLGKAYQKKYLILNYIASIYNFLLYFVIVLVYSQASSSEIEIKFMAYVYLAETVFAFVITKLFSSKLKKTQKAAIAAGTESTK